MSNKETDKTLEEDAKTETQETPETTAEETTTTGEGENQVSEETKEPTEAELAQALRDAYPALPATWSDAEVVDWGNHITPEDMVVLESGVWTYDPTRAKRAIDSWSSEELEASIRQELRHTNVKAGTVMAEYRRRVQMESAWSNAEVTAYVTTGEKPPKTESGLWKNDVTRAQRQVQEWTDAELHGWANGEIPPVGKATELKLAAELRARFNIQGYDDSVKGTLNAYNNQNKKPATSPSKAVTSSGVLNTVQESHFDNTLQEYVKRVGPGRALTTEEGGRAQRVLERLFESAVRLEGPELVVALDKIKNTINANRSTVFSPSMAYRFVHMLKGDGSVQRRHVDFIELFLIVTGPNNKEARAQTDIRGMVKGWPQDRVDLLVEYFTEVA